MKRLPLIHTALTAAVLSLIAGPALAHSGHLATVGFLDGAEHPLTGIDHLLAMVTVGVYAATIGGRALFAVPSSFVGGMLLGGALAFAGVDLPLVEPMIYASVLVLALLCVLPAARSLSLACALAGGFALFHGFAHGAEMPMEASALSYALGFSLSTAGLHVAGIVIGLGLRHVLDRVAGTRERV